MSQPPKLTQTIPSREIGDVENFTILYIDQDKKMDLSLLRPAINFLRIINDITTLEMFLTTFTNEKFIVVMALNDAKSIVLEIHQRKCIQSIYLVSEEIYSAAWINDYGKVVGVYENIKSVYDHLIKMLPHLLFRLTSIEIALKDDTSHLSFGNCQLLKEVIICEDAESDLRNDMLTWCRIHYANNQEKIHEIDEFEKSFVETHSIQWYTRYSFLTKILSRAFRTKEIDLLFKMRYFIQCLHKQIQSNSITESITTYAILDIEDETIEKLRENLNELVLFHSFLSTTFKRPTFDEYSNKENQKHYVFSFHLGPGCASNVAPLQPSNYNIDILINIDIVFRVVSIDEDENGIYTVNLESIANSDSRFRELTESLRQTIKAPVIILQLAKLLLPTGHYREVDYLTELIYQDKSFENNTTLLTSLAAVHHLLGNVNESNRNFGAARYQYFKSLRAFQLFLPYNHPMLSSSYNNIGSMFYQEDHSEYAIKFHEMALECQIKASDPDMNAVAIYSANIGAVYMNQKNYAEAVKHLKRAGMVLEKMTTKENVKNLISMFQKISSCFWHIKEYNEALEYYKKTLDLQLKLPNPSPYNLSVTFYNLSTAYERIGDYDEAVINAERSVEQLRKISENHPELKDNQAQLEIVRQKQWLKQVLFH